MCFALTFHELVYPLAYGRDGSLQLLGQRYHDT